MTRRRFFLIWPIVVLLAYVSFGTVLADNKKPAMEPLGNESADESSNFVIPPSAYTASSVSEDSQKGKVVFERNSCSGCHSIAGKGGCLAPPFDGIGARRDKQFILARITNEAASIREFEKLYGGESELMPHPRISAQNAKLIAAYLLTLPEPSGGVHIVGHTGHMNQEQLEKSAQPLKQSTELTSETIAKGKELFYKQGCMACHTIGHVGGHYAPNLDGISKRRGRDYIVDRITRAEFLTQNYPDEYQQRGIVMPQSFLSTKEISQISDFLMSLP